MSLADYYSDSYPPELWETPAAPVGAARQSATEDEGSTVPAGTVLPVLQAADQHEQGGQVLEVDPDTVPTGTVETADGVEHVGTLPASAALLMVSAGTPGTYDPPQSATERPRNVTELSQRAVPLPRFSEPWQPGEYVPVGERGKRAHWDGEAWRSGEAPPFQSRSRTRR